MSVITKIQSAGLARDPAAQVASDANALRRAENVVLRSPGVIETRPSFDLLYESTVPGTSVRALREFQGTALAVIKNGASWGLTNLSTGVGLGGESMEPVDYDACETKFSESRQNLYATTADGIVALESPTSAPRVTGVPMMMQTDLASVQRTGSTTSCAYRLVFVRKDSNGYIRRSPPSQRMICTVTASPQAFGTATQVYFPSIMSAGDQIEFYRTRTQTGMSPRPEHYLALTHTITAAEAALGRTIDPIVDSTPDDSLGAELYTDPGIDTEAAEKFQPPQAQTLAWWQRVMWYGRTKAPARLVLDLQNLYYAGVASFSAWETARWWTFDTVGGATATVSDTTGLYVGMIVTDNLFGGPTSTATETDPTKRPYFWVKPNSYIASFVANTSATLNQATNAQPAAASPVRTAQQPVMALPTEPVEGLYARTKSVSADANGRLNFFLGEELLATDLHVGMFVTDSALGPLHDGTVFQAGTKIIGKDVFVTGDCWLNKAPLVAASTVVATIGDVVTVNGVEFYAWPGAQGVPWSTATATDRKFFVGTVNDVRNQGPMARARVIQNLSATINAYGFQHAGFPRATPIGDTWDQHDFEYGTDGLREDPGTLASSLLLESDFASLVTVTCTSLTAFPLRDRTTVTETLPPASGWPTPLTYPVASQTSDAPSTPNRVYFSALDEPEAVPLLNYIDIGSKSAPILALVPLRNALLVFKSDGLWRITGAGPSGWSVEPLDNTMTLLRPELVSVSQNKAYAWAKGGFFEVDEGGSRSLSAGKLDVELRQRSLYFSDATTHGAWVAAVQQRNLVLLGVPSAAGGQFTGRVYCYHQTTGAWSEWPVSWSKVAESASMDRVYYNRPEEAAGTGTAEINVEVRKMTDAYNGIDRTYDLGNSLTVDGSTITILLSDIGAWQPVAGDWISASSGGVRVYRRISTASFNGGTSTWTITLEAQASAAASDLLITDAGVFFVTDTGVFFLIDDLTTWQAHEAITLALEWHPAGPAGLPIGAIAREMQFQLDLRDAPSTDTADSLPEYIVGASTERSGTVYSVTSNMVRTATIQPLRAGVSRQVGRGALIAPYFQTSDVYQIRLTGASIVYEGVSEKSRR